MGKLFGWLDRSKSETVRDYDNRINHLQAFHAGYAFLSFENYDPELAGFAAYVVWNGEFNEKLENPMPAGGFMLHCDAEQAQRMCEQPEGFPIFVKLYAKQGRLSAEHMVLADADRIFDFYFNGCEMFPPERLGLVFAGARVPEEAHREEYVTEADRPAVPADPCGGTAVGSYRKLGRIKGSYRGFGAGSYWHGSGIGYRGGLFRLTGSSYWLGSFIGGSYRTGALWSLWRSSYFTGSYALRWGILGGSGIRFGSTGTSSYRTGAFWQWQGSYAQARYGAGSYAGGSFRPARFGSGSFRKSLFRKGSFLRNGSGIAFLAERAEMMPPAAAPGEEAKETQLRSAERGREVYYARIIEEMGYGLDLI
ncbi:MAG: hypothetical protein J6O73_09485 [Lachnospiraceae bacterium]|nr:hypothetical protein [Lachnospiraceae bacterium]